MKQFFFSLFFLISKIIYSQVNCTGGTSNIPRSGVVTVNGVTITTSYSGDVQNYAYSWSSCNGDITTSTNSLWVGYLNPWSITLNFNKPVNDLVIALTATGTGTGSSSNENFIFNSNGGAVSITAGTNCYSTIVGNQIFSGAGVPVNTSGSSGGGGGLFRVRSSNAYTKLVISGNGGSAGSLMAICELSIKPACTLTTAPTVKNLLTNTCPATFVDLGSAHTGITPSGAELLWFTNNTHSGSALTSNEVSRAGAGTYYAYYYDNINGCYSPASGAVTVNIIACCPVFTSFSQTGWSARVYDAPAGTDGWTEISNANNFPTSSYSQIATFDYNAKVNTYEAFSIDFHTLTYGLRSSNPQIQNYSGSQIYYDFNYADGGNLANEDYAVIFNKTVANGEEGTYKFDLSYGDDHIFIYKNGVKLNQINDAYYGGPFTDFVNVYLAAGDVISVLIVEEYLYNTAVVISGEKKPLVKNLLNNCPANSVNLNDSLLTTTPSGATVLWFNNSTHSGTALTGAQVANAGAGTYYAFYFNGSGCYSPASNAVTVTINSCVCYRDPVNNGSGTETKMGITLLKRAGSDNQDNWPMVRKSGHIALESNTQGFVVTRIAKADLGNITNPQEGMMVYDTTDKCLKIYSDNAWKCFSTPACPDESPIPPVINPNNPPEN